MKRNPADIFRPKVKQTNTKVFSVLLEFYRSGSSHTDYVTGLACGAEGREGGRRGRRGSVRVMLQWLHAYYVTHISTHTTHMLPRLLDKLCPLITFQKLRSLSGLPQPVFPSVSSTCTQNTHMWKRNQKRAARVKGKKNQMNFFKKASRTQSSVPSQSLRRCVMDIP